MRRNFLALATILCLFAALYAIVGMVMSGAFTSGPNSVHWMENFYVWMMVAAGGLVGAAVGMVLLGKKKTGRE